MFCSSPSHSPYTDLVCLSNIYEILWRGVRTGIRGAADGKGLSLRRVTQTGDSNQYRTKVSPPTRTLGRCTGLHRTHRPSLKRFMLRSLSWLRQKDREARNRQRRIADVSNYSPGKVRGESVGKRKHDALDVALTRCNKRSGSTQRSFLSLARRARAARAASPLPAPVFPIPVEKPPGSPFVLTSLDFSYIAARES